MSSSRLTCIAPGCRRTHAADGFTEWLCAHHWALVPKDTRRAYHRARRLCRRGRKSGHACARLWARCVRIATIETLQGIGV